MSRDSELVDCAVVGGGPSGLVLASLLARRRWRVTVIEEGEGTKAPSLNISPFLSPPSLRLFADLGLVDELNRIGQPVREVVESAVDGSRYTLDYAERVGDWSGYALSVPLFTLSNALRRTLTREASAELLSGTAVRGVRQSGNAVTLDLVDAEGARPLECRFVVCADGKFSKVRDLAGIAAQVSEFDRPLVMVVVPKPAGWPERIALHHGEHDSLVAVMPIAGGDLAVQWLADPDEFEQVRAGQVEELRSRLTRALPELTDLLTTTVTDWDRVLTVRYHMVRPRAWSSGRVGLLGDGAHGVHSLGGQGLNLGIQDAMVLGSLLVEAGVDSGVAPLEEYERLRKPYVENFQDYQLALPQLTSQSGGGNEQTILYEAIADMVTGGQPEALASYQRLVDR
ncbi:FAD-dependent oxidoreductase [Actinokineospora spheciospongiae]|uniref:FAD-dependent oxidoreductase n=1 Tax=Actinokineospora spheciospongiae TaxID=909613 RepID=UPI000D717B50|nr:NAD(P)/FAD-dependent oxidoreductase [Actinokineospora spheciospongiae]PWW55545.1 2-polyprenyl-6-methoxyphenol hydroxylase-like FAD-dependent oxidoreductase [Actinokineospora spheciospongiae]